MVSALALLLGLVSTAMAEDVDLGKISTADIKSMCDSQGGKFADYGQIYGCTKACPGGKCGVICDKDDGCIGVTPQNRQQGAAGERGVADVLNAKSNATPDQGNKGFSWGLLGLLGFAGLVGLVRHKTR